MERDDDRQLVAKVEVTQHTKMEVTPTEDIASTDTKVIATGDMEVIPLTNMEAIAPSSTELSVHNDEGFLGGLSNCFVLTGFVDHVTLRLWHEEIYIYYV